MDVFLLFFLGVIVPYVICAILSDGRVRDAAALSYIVYPLWFGFLAVLAWLYGLLF